MSHTPKICPTCATLRAQLADLTRQRDEARERCDKLASISRHSLAEKEKHLRAANKGAETNSRINKSLIEQLASLRLQLEAETKARVAAELAHETDTGRLKADLATMRGLLAREVLIEDDYGVHGSTFYTCPFCHQESGAGALNKGIPHDPKCILAGECNPCESIVAMAEERDTLTARVAELEADREDLDWLEAWMRESWHNTLQGPDKNYGFTIQAGWHPARQMLGEAVTLRAAIRAARSAQPEGGV